MTATAIRCLQQETPQLLTLSPRSYVLAEFAARDSAARDATSCYLCTDVSGTAGQQLEVQPLRSVLTANKFTTYCGIIINLKFLSAGTAEGISRLDGCQDRFRPLPGVSSVGFPGKDEGSRTAPPPRLRHVSLQPVIVGKFTTYCGIRIVSLHTCLCLHPPPS